MKRKLLIICRILTATVVSAQSPSFEWAKNMGGVPMAKGNSIAVDASGNVYSTGTFEGTADFDPGSGTYNLTSAGYYDIFISKLDAFGNFLWAKRIGGVSDDIGHSIAVDGSGNVYSTGYFSVTADFDPGAATFNLTSSGFEDIYILKLSTFGNFLWAKSMGGSSHYDQGNSIEVDASGNVYTAGSFQQTVDFEPDAGTFNLTSSGSYDIFISKLTTSGNFVWAKKIGGTAYDQGTSISLDPSGNVLTTGTFQGTVDFDPGIGTADLSAEGNDIFISKLTSSGNYVWAKKMGGTSYDYGQSIKSDEFGNVLTIGSFEGTADFDSGAGAFSLSSSGSADIFISKLDASGNFVWAKKMGGTSFDDGKSIELDALGNVYTTGSFYGTADFDPGSGIFNLTSAGSADIFISKLNASGNFVWAIAMGEISTDGATSIDVDASGSVYTTGSFIGTVDFDPGAGTFLMTTTGGSYAVFVHKMSQCLNPSPPVNTTSAANLNICNGNHTTLTAQGIGILGWYSAPTGGTFLTSGNSFVTPLLTGTVTYYVQDSTCQSSGTRTAVLVTVNSLPTISAFASATTVCAGQAVTLTGGGGATYVWTGGVANGISFVPASTSTYTLIGTDGNNCSNTVAITITVKALPDVTTTVNGISIMANQNAAVYQWLDCNGGYSVITSATNQVYSATVNGNYAVMVTKNGCLDTSACVNISTLGISPLSFGEGPGVRFFPNPSKGSFTVSLSGVEGQSTKEGVYSIMNELGQSIQSFKLNSTNNYKMNIENLSNGIYFIVGNNNNHMTKQKIVVTK